MDFSQFKHAVALRFASMQEHPLVRVNTNPEGDKPDALWELYLASFPEGTNPIYRKRTEYDCSCCRHFVRAVGNAVAIINGELVSVWDIEVQEPAFQAVANSLSSYVKSCVIKDKFLHFENHAGTNQSFESLVEGGVRTWNHFYVNIKKEFVLPGKEIPAALAKPRESKEVLLRALREIDDDTIGIVLDLIRQGSIYRGDEFRHMVEGFRNLKSQYLKASHYMDAIDGVAEDIFAWTAALNPKNPESILRIRNSVIGTLLVDIQEGMPLDKAVDRYEEKVAPENYKRPTALVTPGMIAKAKEQIAELGLTSALQRRHAVLSDIAVPNILFVDRTKRKSLAQSTDVFDDLEAQVMGTVKAKSFDQVAEVPIAKFLADILPESKEIEVLVENRLLPNFVALIAPEDPTAGRLFKWDNLFSWSYQGAMADSDLRKAVQARGGRVDGVFRFSHTWNYAERNTSLMDLHVFMPGSNIEPGNPVNDYYGNNERVGWNNRNHPRSGGTQDVDYTDAAPEGYVPVENITWPTLSRMPEGRYVCKIHNWQLRQPTRGGFRAEIEFGGEVFQYEYTKPLWHKEWVTVAEVTLKDDQFTIKHHLPTTTSSVLMWGLNTQTWARVNVVMLSPNHWDELLPVGNKHYFFMLDGCKSDDTVRGMYNEFLDGRLDPHRKVLELVGSKVKIPEAKDQLSGLGFSSTQRNTLICRVKGSIVRTIKIVF